MSESLLQQRRVTESVTQDLLLQALQVRLLLLLAAVAVAAD
jgi:hypothetical protein